MNEQIAQTITVQRETLARAVAACFVRKQPDLEASFAARIREQCERDAGVLLHVLADAVRVDRPEIFINHVAWVKATCTGLSCTPEDLLQELECLRREVQRALPAGQQTLADAYLVEVLTCLPLLPADLPSYMDANLPLADLAADYLDALLAGKRHSASRLILEAIARGVTVEDVYLNVFQPVQREVGRLWQANRISVAMEHYCTAATQLVMSQLYPHIFSTEKTGRRFVATCVGGDLHEIGLRMVADFLEMAGWDTYYLGADVPAESVVQTLAERSPHVLGVSVTMPYHLDAARALIGAVRVSEPGRAVKILVGGFPFNSVPDLWRDVGADAFARDAREAVGAAKALVESATEDRS